MRQISFPFEPDDRRSREDPTSSETRLVWILFTLLRGSRVDTSQVIERFESSERAVRRDITKLRTMFERLNFSEKIVTSGKAQYELRRRPGADVHDTGRETLELVQEIARGLGGPIVEHFEPAGSQRDPFLRINAPRLVQGTATARIYDELRKAAANRARVVFEYRNQRGEVREREVEPYLTVWNAGRYYLIGYDTKAGFRQFALDAIKASLPLRRRGTFAARPIPPRYRSDDAIGMFKSSKPTSIRVALSALIAPAITAREWQKAQQIARDSSDSATIVFADCDIDEVVRWARGRADFRGSTAKQRSVVSLISRSFCQCKGPRVQRAMHVG